MLFLSAKLGLKMELPKFFELRFFRDAMVNTL